MDFVAIDFETANSQRTSACSIGLAFVENDIVVDSKEYLIKPYPNEFHPFNSSIHGIKQSDVCSSPNFKELWQELFFLLDGKMLVAHNASFDISVLGSVYSRSVV